MNNQEYTHVALGGIIRDSSTSPDGVREIKDFEVHEASLVPAEEQAMDERRPPSPEGLDAAIRARQRDPLPSHGVSIERAEHDIRYAVKRLSEKEASPITEQGKSLQVLDECKEMSPQDFEKISEVLRDCMELQGGIQTAKSDWLRQRFAAGRRPGKTFESMGVPSIWALDVCEEDEEGKTDE